MVGAASPWLSVSCTLVVLVSCANDDGEPMSVGDGLPDPPAAGEWLDIMPGGDTVCSRGAPYAFVVRGGRSDRVLINFQGGGACWDEVTCSVADSLFADSVVSTAQVIEEGIADGAVGGVFARDGVFADWTVVHIPYCTGDVHWGNATRQYNDELTIEHKGYVNARAALDWMYARFDPERIFVTGCSAGAYGAALHAAYIADHYRDAQLVMLADSGSGIITDSFLTDSLPNWNAEPNIPPFIDSLQRPITELTLPDLYIGIAGHFPEQRFAQVATQFDDDQVFFYTAMGGDAVDWPGLFLDSLDEIEDSVQNFRSYVPPGPMHCVTPYPFFDMRTVGGVNLADWTEQLVLGDRLPDSQRCQGEACFDDPICDACAEDSNPAWCRFCENWPEEWQGMTLPGFTDR